MQKSTKSKFGLTYFSIFILLLGIFLFWAKINPQILVLNSPPSLPAAASVQEVRPLVKIDRINIPVELATSSQAVQKGLSGRPSLDQEKGMLFVFSKPYKYRFWMPDMYFPLDMIWINNGQVVDITKNASTNFNPQNPVFYTPVVPAQYMLEVNAGFADRNHISKGDPTSLINIK